MTETDIVMFAGLSGDYNPVHMDREYAADSRFGQRIAHGMLTSVLSIKTARYGASGTRIRLFGADP